MYNIEQLHEQGKMPTLFYNQLNEKSAQENYISMRLKEKNEHSKPFNENML